MGCYSYIYISDCDKNRILSQIISSKTKENPGWETDFDYGVWSGSESSERTFSKDTWKHCGNGTTWFGFTNSAGVGSLSVMLSGAGTIKLNYENCWHAGSVRRYLNGEQIDTTGEKFRSPQTNEFSFVNGDVLKLTDEVGAPVVRLNAIEFRCSA